MRMQPIEQAVKELPCDALVVGVHADGQMNAALTDLDQTMHGAISKLIACEEITGKCLEITEFLAPSGLAADRLIVVGLGDRQELDQAAVFPRLVLRQSGWHRGRASESSTALARNGHTSWELLLFAGRSSVVPDRISIDQRNACRPREKSSGRASAPRCCNRRRFLARA